MSGFEQSGYASSVEERTALLANEAGRRVALHIEDILQVHVLNGLIGEDQLAAIKAAEYSRAETNFRVERDAGLHNDLQSLGVGLTATITTSGKTRIERFIDTYMEADLVPQFTELPGLDGVYQQPLYQMALPFGTYSALRGDLADKPTINEDPFGVVFYSGGHTDIFPAGHKIIAYKPDIIRIEGSAGELWQNPVYTPEGQVSGKTRSL